MGLGLLQGDVCAEDSEAAHQRFTDFLIDGQDALPRCNRYNTVRHFIGMKDRASAGWASDYVNSCFSTLLEVDLSYVLMPTQRNSGRIPAIESDDGRPIGRDERLRKSLVILHVERASPTPSIPKLPDHLMMNVARNDTALALRNKREDRFDLGTWLDFFRDAGHRLRYVEA